MGSQASKGEVAAEANAAAADAAAVKTNGQVTTPTHPAPTSPRHVETGTCGILSNKIDGFVKCGRGGIDETWMWGRFGGSQVGR